MARHCSGSLGRPRAGFSVAPQVEDLQGCPWGPGRGGYPGRSRGELGDEGGGQMTLEALPTPVQAFHLDPGASLQRDLVRLTSTRLFSGLSQSVRFCPEQPGCGASGQGHTPAAATERQGPDPEPSPCPADPPLGHRHHQRDPLHLLEGGEGVLAGSASRAVRSAPGAQGPWGVGEGQQAVGGGGWAAGSHRQRKDGIRCLSCLLLPPGNNLSSERKSCFSPKRWLFGRPYLF